MSFLTLTGVTFPSRVGCRSNSWTLVHLENFKKSIYEIDPQAFWCPQDWVYASILLWRLRDWWSTSHSSKSSTNRIEIKLCDDLRLLEVQAEPGLPLLLGNRMTDLLAARCFIKSIFSPVESKQMLRSLTARDRVYHSLSMKLTR